MNKRTIRTKKIWSMLLAAVLIVSVVTPAVAATARATTMKLEKTEGTVTLKTQNGSSRKPTNGMRLLNGNTLATAASSYAHISLDSTKAVKLDQNSSTTVRQSGKQLELLVKSGQLFFNVSEKLTQKESLNIRTSSMVAGIRGTCGVVEKVNPAMSKLYLIEGQVTLGTGENATTVYGGQTATVILRPKNETGESGGSGDNGNTAIDMEQKVYVEKLTEANVPIFAITEVLSDPVLQQKIEATTELKIEKLKEALAESQKEPGAEEKKPEETTAPSSGGSYGGSSGGGVSDSSSEPGTGDVPDPVEEIITVTGGAVTVDAINKALESGGIVKLTAESSADALTSIEYGDDQRIVVPSGGGLVVAGSFSSIPDIAVNNGGVLTINNDAQLYCSGMIQNNGTIINNGTLQAVEPGVFLASGSKLENNGKISGYVTIGSGGTLDNNGTIEGGVCLPEDNQADGQTSIKTTIKNAAEKEITAWDNWYVSNAIIENAGKINMDYYAIVVTDTLDLKQVGTITGSGEAVIKLTNSASIILGTSGNSSNGSIRNSNSDGGYVIEVDQEIMQGQNKNIVWNNNSVVLQTDTGDIGYTVQGLTLENNSLGYLDIGTGELSWSVDTNTNIGTLALN